LRALKTLPASKPDHDGYSLSGFTFNEGLSYRRSSLSPMRLRVPFQGLQGANGSRPYPQSFEPDSEAERYFLRFRTLASDHTASDGQPIFGGKVTILFATSLAFL
jgi:hypothetical protein